MPILTKIMESIVQLSSSGGSEVEGDGNPPLPPTPTVPPPSTFLTAALETSEVIPSVFSNGTIPAVPNSQVRILPVTDQQVVPALDSSMSVSYNRLPNPLTQLLQQ